MFDEDAYFGSKSTKELIENAENVNVSVIVRGRSIVQIGMRAHDDERLSQKLAEWAVNPEFQHTEWVGTVSIAWVSACALAYSDPTEEGRRKVRSILGQWDSGEREMLLNWAKRESWFNGIS